jgi:tetratricopeptide (TPR) repeat protein
MYKLLLYALSHISFVIIFATGLSARQGIPEYQISDDSLYFKARDFALAGETDKALDAATLLYGRNPLYHDAAVLIARIYAREKNYGSARKYIYQITGKNPAYYDALSVLADIEIWEGNHMIAIETLNKALSFHPDDEDFLYKKATAYMRHGLTAEAIMALDRILEINPGNQEAKELLDSLSTPGFYYFRENHYLLSGYSGEFFRSPYKRHMHIGTAGYSHYTVNGPLAFKLNFANTYIDGSGMTRYPSLQYEIESYPRLSSGEYLLLNYAFSRSIVFPGHRGAFEYFRALPSGFEA